MLKIVVTNVVTEVTGIETAAAAVVVTTSVDDDGGDPTDVIRCGASRKVDGRVTISPS